MMRERVVFWLKLSTVPFAAGLWYLVYRAYRPYHEDSEGEGHFEEKAKKSNFRLIRVRVPKRAVGAVIGKAGSVIQGLQQSTGARVTFGNRDVGDTADEEVIIRGSSKAVEEAEREVRRIIAAIPAIECEELRLASRYVGPFIGRSGENIRAIMNRTRAKIDVERGSGLSNDRGEIERLVTVRGSRAQIDDVIESIRTLQEEIDAKERRAEELRCEAEVLLCCDTPLEVLVSVVKNPTTLYLQLASRSHALEPLIRRLTEYYTSRPPPRSINFRPGELVAALYVEDNSWHRARVVEVTPEIIDVDYVDYGDCAELTLDQVRPLHEPSFCSLPLQAVEVKLHGCQAIQGVDEAHAERGASFLEDITYAGKGVPLHATVVSNEGGVPSVRLADPNKDKADINAAMITAGFCARVTSS